MSQLRLTKKTGPCFSKTIEINSIDDLQTVLQTVLKNRTAASTKMNLGSKDHAGSSRSHAALILRLYQIDKEGKYQKSEFHLIDLAGAERPDKVGVERVSAYDIMTKLMTQKNAKIGVAEQGFLINYELSELHTLCVNATDAHKKGKPFKVATSLTPPGIQYVAQLINGSCIMNMIICLSQAPQNGWETWFSLKYGTDLSKLEIKIPKQKPTDFKKYLAQVTKEDAEFAKKADPKAPVTAATPIHKDNYAKSQFLLSVLKSFE